MCSRGRAGRVSGSDHAASSSPELLIGLDDDLPVEHLPRPGSPFAHACGAGPDRRQVARRQRPSRRYRRSQPSKPGRYRNRNLSISSAWRIARSQPGSRRRGQGGDGKAVDAVPDGVLVTVPIAYTTTGRPAAMASMGVRPKVSWILSEREQNTSAAAQARVRFGLRARPGPRRERKGKAWRRRRRGPGRSGRWPSSRTPREPDGAFWRGVPGRDTWEPGWPWHGRTAARGKGQLTHPGASPSAARA